MATLEKIRSKSVFLIVVIGVALLAFIIGDALTNSQNLFGDRSTVAKIGGDKIDYTEYQRKREELNNQLEEARRQNPQQYANFDTQILGQMAIDQLVGEKLLDEAADAAGIQVGGNILRHYILDQPVNPEIQTILQQLAASGLSVSTPAQAYDVIFNPARHGLTSAQVEPFQRAWIAMEEGTRKLVKRQIYQRLVYNTIKANDLDKKALYDDYVGTTQVDVAFLPFGALDEKTYPVSAEEINAAYAEEKGRFKVDEENKEISFIAVNVAVSDADRKAASELARQTAAALRDSAGTLSKNLKKEGLSVERKNVRLSDVASTDIRNYVASAPADSVSIVSESLRGFTVVKMGSRNMQVDSVTLNLVQVAGKTLPAKILASLNSGLAIDSVMTAFPKDSVMVQADQSFALYTADGPTQALQQSQLDTLRQAGGRYISLVSGDEGALIAKLTRQSAPVEVVEYEQVNYVLGPSSKTVNDERAKLEKFLSENKTAKDFNANASKAGYNVQKYTVSQSTPAVPRMMGMQSYYPDSRQVIRWVMIDGETGDVSHIYESKDAVTPALYAVAVDATYDDYAPTTNEEIKAYLTEKVRRDKAGDALVKKYQPSAKNVQAAAQAMGVEPQNVQAFRFGYNGIVRDPSVMGRINGAKADKKVVVAKGDDGVYVYQVIGKNTEKFEFNPDMYEQQYFQIVNPQFGQMLKGSKKLKNNVYKFEAGD